MKKLILFSLIFVLIFTSCSKKSEQNSDEQMEEQIESNTLNDLSASVKIPENTKGWKELSIETHGVALKYPKNYIPEKKEDSMEQTWYSLKSGENESIDVQIFKINFEDLIKQEENLMVVNQKTQITMDNVTGIKLEGVQPGQIYILLPLKDVYSLKIANISMKTEENFKEILQTLKFTR